jgi:hypothetical protein
MSVECLLNRPPASGGEMLKKLRLKMDRSWNIAVTLMGHSTGPGVYFSPYHPTHVEHTMLEFISCSLLDPTHVQPSCFVLYITL